MSYYHRKEGDEYKETSGDVGQVYYLDCGDGLQVFVYIQTHEIIQAKCEQFSVYQLYLNKTVVKNYIWLSSFQLMLLAKSKLS